MISARVVRSLIGVIGLLAHSGWAAEYWVSPGGNDAASGGVSAPWRTLGRASRSPAGSVLHVLAGDYGEAVVIGNGNQSWLGEVGARITTGADTAVQISASGVVFAGFDVTGGGAGRIGVYVSGSNDLVRNNVVHDIGTSNACGSAGGGGIVTDHWAGGVKDDVIGNNVYNIGPGSGCNTVQGIYPQTSGVIGSNVVHNNAGWGIVTYHDATDVVVMANDVSHDGVQSGGIGVGCGGFYKITSCDRFRVVNNNVHDEPNIGLLGSTSVQYIGRNSYATGNVLTNVRYGCVDMDLLDMSGQVCPANP